MITQTITTVSTSATLLINSTGSPQIVVVTNLGSSNLYVGDSTITTSTGLEIEGGESFSIDLGAREYLYGICALGTIQVLTMIAAYGPTHNLPERVDLGLGSSIPASPATVITTTAGLPGSPVNGQLALLRLGTWPDTEYVPLAYDSVASRWVSTPESIISMTDLIFMGTNTTAYSYVSTNAAGATVGGIGWSTRPIRHASSILAAGLTLQAVATGITGGSTVPAIATTQCRFFNHDSGDTVTFSSDGSTAVAELLTPMTSNAAATPTIFKSTGWTNVVGLGTVVAVTSAQVTKANLWPRVYMKVASGAAYGQIIDLDLQCRWVV